MNIIQILNQGVEFRPRLRWGIIGMAAAVFLVGFLFFSASTFRIGFPLDDAWIHQTYARNLAEYGQWVFNPGQVSAGSTSPLWSILLSIGFFLGIGPYYWTYLLGWFLLACLGFMASQIEAHWSGHPAKSIPWIGIFIVGEWHLVWSAGSGMETNLYALAILLLFFYMSREKSSPFLAGIFSGALTWIRPEGLTMFGPVLFCFFFRAVSNEKRFRAALFAVAGLALGIIPYLLFNQWIGGQWWPNTFFAKQAEYSVRLQESFVVRFFRLAVIPWIGSGFILLPGLLYAFWKSIRKRHWPVLASILWWLGTTTLYSLSLPVDYQHGRYLMPAIPVILLVAWYGTSEIFKFFSHERRLRLVRFGWITAAVLLWIAFLVVGGFTYSQDVAIIETEMVDTATWIANHTSPKALIAAHDIGALGYFGHRNIIDLAGLVSPEVIPIIRDEGEIKILLDQKGTDYLLTFPGWYPQLVMNGDLVYQSSGIYSIGQGGENMAVFRWRLPGNQK